MINKKYNTYILICLSNHSYEEVFASPSLAIQMLDNLPQELFMNSKITFLNPVCKLGVFLREMLSDNKKRKIIDFEYSNEVYLSVECLPSYVSSMTKTIYIPITPIKLGSSVSFGGSPGSSGLTTRGIAFNGVIFDAPAPTSITLAVFTLAPFDDAGAHINMDARYHYHAAIGKSKEIVQTDGHAPKIGYALDGFGMYARLSVAGT